MSARHVLTIDADVMRVLSTAEVDGNALRITAGQLERKLYERLNKILEAAGGKWSRGAKAHVFQEPADSIVEELILTGEVRRVKQELGQFDTPPELATRLVDIAEVKPDMSVLEPSAGTGNIVAAIKAAGGIPFGVEIDPKRWGLCPQEIARMIVLGDFLKQDPSPLYDRVVMNPPFAERADIRHVLHAAKFLKPGGRLAAIVSLGTRFREDAATRRFREFVMNQIAWELADLPDDAFASSGTRVRAMTVTFEVSP